jgi:hypothetical protein
MLLLAEPQMPGRKTEMAALALFFAWVGTLLSFLPR